MFLVARKRTPVPMDSSYFLTSVDQYIIHVFKLLALLFRFITIFMLSCYH